MAGIEPAADLHATDGRTDRNTCVTNAVACSMRIKAGDGEQKFLRESGVNPMGNQLRKSSTGTARAHLMSYVHNVFGLAVILTFSAFALFASILEAYLW